MKVSKTAGEYTIVDAGAEIVDSLPAKVFEVKFHRMRGTWLAERKSPAHCDFKVYGSSPRRVEKVFRTFGLRDKNLGVLLSGEKGMGKSVFMRLLSEEAIKRGLPVIVIEGETPGLANFISSIDQECIVLFDEFEKNFAKNDLSDDDEEVRECSNCEGGQKQFLSLFDGLDSGKKMFVVAVNNNRRLSSFFLNRPGRFYYHFRFDTLGEDEVREYAADNLKEKDDEIIDRLALVARFHELSYDSLSALVTELNNGYSIDETLEDLNVNVEDNGKNYELEVNIKGKTYKGKHYLRRRPGETEWVEFNDDNGHTVFTMWLYPDKMHYDRAADVLFLDRGGVCTARVELDFDEFKVGKDGVDRLLNCINRVTLRPYDIFESFGANGLSYLF